MTLEEFIKTFDGGTGHTVLTVATSAKKYCYQEKYDIFALPWWVEGEKERQKLIEMYQRSKKKEDIVILPETSWWKEAKDKKVIGWDMIRGEGTKPRELWIFLSEVLQ